MANQGKWGTFSPWGKTDPLDTNPVIQCLGYFKEYLPVCISGILLGRINISNYSCVRLWLHVTCLLRYIQGSWLSLPRQQKERERERDPSSPKSFHPVPSQLGKKRKMWSAMSNHLIQYNTSGIRQKGESQNGCFKKTKHAKFSEKKPDEKVKSNHTK